MANYLKARENGSDCGNLTWIVRFWSLGRVEIWSDWWARERKKHEWEFLQRKKRVAKKIVAEQQNRFILQKRKKSGNAVTVCEPAGVWFGK